MARENRSDRGAMLALASLMVVFSLTVIGVLPAGAYYYDTDGDGLADFYEIKHGTFGSFSDEVADWDGDGLNDVVEDANANGIVDVGETDPWNSDTDGDGISDGIEGLVDSSEDADTLINALDLDSDGDFISDAVEYFGGTTDWLDPDSDDDGIIDGWEAMWGTDPLDPNTDDDGWLDGQEVAYGSKPTVADSDADGRTDGIGNEDNADADEDGQINALDVDSDNDGVIDSQEDYNENGVVDADEIDPELYDTDSDGFSDGYEIYEALSDPLTGEDSDGDGWMDGQEVTTFKTDPNDADTDGDGIGDGVENPVGTPYPGVDSDADGLIDALDLDSDNDGIDDSEEVVSGSDGYVTNPVSSDTDGDDFTDNAEIQIYGTDPTDGNDPTDGDGVPSWLEFTIYETNFDLDDTDDDGVDDGLSPSRGNDYMDVNTDGSRPIPFRDQMSNALDWDSDGDGLYDGNEVSGGTDPLDFDTDGDGGGDPYLLMDGAEVHIWGTDPNDTDSDDDGLSDYDEIYVYHTDPLGTNSDGDYADDATEAAWGSNPHDPDTDGDGILDGETATGTYYDADGVLQTWTFVEDNTDVELGGDGLSNVLDVDSDWREWENPPTYTYLDFHDRTEMAYSGYVTTLVARDGRDFHDGDLNPGNPDTDGDGFPDATEVACGFDPLDARDYGDCPYTPDDTDGDGLFDIEEVVLDGAVPPPTMQLVADFDGDGLSDGDEMHPTWWHVDGVDQYTATNPLEADTDFDGLDDLEEVTLGADGFITNPHSADTDGDGVSDGDEATAGTDPTDVDTDNDDLTDGFEVATSTTDPLDGDTDDDGIYDGHEVAYGTDPLDPDTDDDLIVDGWEVGYEYNPVKAMIGADTDPLVFGAGDADTLTQTDPRLVDSDFDTFSDGNEDTDQDGAVDPGETDPSDRDTDNDLLPDYYEIAGNVPSSPYCVGWVDNNSDGTDPTLADTEADGLRDDIEFAQLCDPNDMDTDDDGLNDGPEYITFLTDPSNADTDSDGCDDGVGPGDVESPTVDTDGDLIVNAMDVDSDNDWVWDCHDGETLADDDGDVIPNVLDNDSDNDFLSDVQEMGLDTWHVLADNDRDFDEDGILDGDEYFQVIHQPHTGEVGFRASSPTLFDTDADGLHDGFEVGKTAGYPDDPMIGGTVPDPGVWDFDGTPNSDVRLWDSDMDGLTDLDEDADVDGDDTDLYVTETHPEDDDSDEDGLLDGYELVYTPGARDPFTHALDCDTDNDDLGDGLEWGILEPMGEDTEIGVWECTGSQFDDTESGAYTTNPLDSDSDNDGLADGIAEDQNQNGTRDGGDPYDSIVQAGDETDPNVWDTDRSGEADATDSSPVNKNLGDWDIDIDNNGGNAVADTLGIGGPTGIAPGSSGSADIVVWHTNGGNNPDAFDGPSSVATIDSVYVRATSFHWNGELPGSSYDYPDADNTDWFHYTQMGFSADVIMGLAAGTSQTITVTANVPFGAMPGWYLGYVAVETQRQPMPNELPDDYIAVKVYVAEARDIDICDDDGDPLGVGLASDPLYFPDPAAQGEMHLITVPGYTIPMVGMFRVANPNTYPDGTWPYPGGTPDGINDLNGLPALPSPGRTWDTNTLDPQGNMTMYDVKAQYEFLSGPADPTSAISFDDPLLAIFALGVVDSFNVTIDTTTLLLSGLYVGDVRVYEDLNGNDVWDVDECSDTFVLKFLLAIPDLDIDDDYANMTGNEITIEVDPGDIDIMIGEILLYNAGETTNVDPWDGPSTEPSLGFWYYDPTTNDATRIPTHPGDDPAWIPITTYLPDLSYSLEVWVGGLLGDSLAIGQSSKLRLWIPSVPETIEAGVYRTDNPDDWVPGDGTVPITTRGLATGQEGSEEDWLPIVYDEDITATDLLMDYFQLTISVAERIDAEFASALMVLAGDPGTQVCGIDVLNNIGNVTISDVHFTVTNLVGTEHGLVIPSTAVDFTPMNQSIPFGGNGSVEICVAIPMGMQADTYVGTVTLLGGAGTPYDELTLNVVVNCIAQMDVDSEAYGVEGNVMTLAPTSGGTDSKEFRLCNIGNCDASDVAVGVTGLPAGLTASASVAGSLPWDECIIGTVQVTWTDPALAAGTYHGTVTVTASGGLSDTFGLDVVVAPIWDAQFASSSFGLYVYPGETSCDDIMVQNLGNQTMADIHFSIENLLGYYGDVIPSSAIDFDPVTMSIAAGQQQSLEICGSVPVGKRADTYVGTAALLANGEELYDNLEVSVTVYCVPDMTVVDNAYNVLGNVMTLAPEPGGTAIGEFQLRNLGNCDLSYIDGAPITGLPAGVSGVVEIAESCPWNESIIGEVHVTWSDPQVPAGSYATTVTITAEDDRDLVDNFALIVNIAELPSLAFVQESVGVIGVAGEIAEAHATVWNTGNVDIATGITFIIDDLVGATGSFIPGANVVFDPPTAAVADGDTSGFDLHITVPEGLIGQDYEGMLKVYLNGHLEDEISVTVTLERGEDITIYPNPYKMSEHEGGITIALGDVDTDNLAIKIYDMFGLLVADLVGGEEPTRDREVQWDLTNDDGKDVASGMYIVTIDTGDKVVTRKIMVIK